MNGRRGAAGSLFLFTLLATFTLLVGCAPNAPAVDKPSPILIPTPVSATPTAVVRLERDWPTSEPEAQGMDSAKLEAMLDRIEERRLNLHSVSIIRNGYLVFEQYYRSSGPSSEQVLWSVTKSFVGTLVGIAIDQGLIAGVDQPLGDFLPVESAANPDPHKNSLTFENVLTMQAGLAWDDVESSFREINIQPDWVSYMLDKPLVQEPGTTFSYCSGCSHLLTAALAKAVGGDLPAFARQNLFEPVGIINLSWEEDPQGIPVGGWGLSLTTRDMARLGYLYLRQGEWNGRQVVSSEWVAASTQAYAWSNEKMGYGYHWWTYPSLNGFAALGFGGQMVFVIPAQDLVVVFTAESTSHEELFDIIETFIAVP